MIAVLTAVAVGVLITSLAFRLTDSKAVRIIAFATLVVHIVISLAVYGAAGLALPDAELYNTLSVQVAGILSHQNVPPLAFSAGKEGWVYVLGTAYWITGDFPAVGLVINSVASALTVVTVAHASRSMGLDQRIQARAALVVAVAPPLITWNSFLLRDAGAVFLIAVLFAAVVRQLNGIRADAAVTALVAAVGLYYFRATALLIVVAGFGLALLLRNRSRRLDSQTPSTSATRALKPLVIGAVLVGALIVLQVAASFLGWNFDHVNATRSATAADGSTSLGQAEPITGPVDAVIQSVRSLPFATLGPFPWDYSLTGIGVLTGVDAIFWAIVLWCVIRGWRYFPNRGGRTLCAVPALVLLVAIGLTTGAYGSIVRYRAMAVPFAAPLAALGLCSTKARRSGHWSELDICHTSEDDARTQRAPVVADPPSVTAKHTPTHFLTL